VVLTCDDNRLTTPDDARPLLTLALSLALSKRTVQDAQHRNVVTPRPPLRQKLGGT
jgi:hypothetical protein